MQAWLWCRDGLQLVLQLGLAEFKRRDLVFDGGARNASLYSVDQPSKVPVDVAKVFGEAGAFLVFLSFPPKTGPLFLETEGGRDGSKTTFRRGYTEATA